MGFRFLDSKENVLAYHVFPISCSLSSILYPLNV